jgi:hypothetical protein
MATSINIAIPSIGREFSVDAITLSWISKAYHLAAAMFHMPLGGWRISMEERKYSSRASWGTQLCLSFVGLPSPRPC